MRNIIAFILLVLSWSSWANAQVTNYGFENGDYSGWTVSNGSTTLKTTYGPDGQGVQVTTGMQNYCPGGGKCWTITPYGSYMVTLQAGGGSPNFDNAMTTLGLQPSAITTIKNTIYSNGNMWPTNATSISRTVYLQAGVTYTYAWQYLSTDYVPYNDGSMITLTGGPGTATINGQTQDYALLGFTNPGTGNYSTESYGATGWQVAVFTVPTDGNYLLGFSSFNLGDTALSPILFIDQMTGTTLLNGATFTPVQPNSGSTAPPPPSPEPTYPAVTISGTQQTKMNQVNAITNNNIYIDNVGDNTSVTIEQHGYYNSFRGINGAQYAYINGNNNTLTVKQGGLVTPSNNNLVELSLIGGNNTLDINQKQTNKYLETSINGSNNILNVTQHGTNSKSAFVNLSSNSNTINLTQQGTGNHFADISSPFGGANVSITQDGSAQKLFSLILNSSNIGVTIIQNNSTTSDSAVMSITCSTPPCTGYTYTKN